jgi:hypothetical protein
MIVHVFRSLLMISNSHRIMFELSELTNKALCREHFIVSMYSIFILIFICEYNRVVPWNWTCYCVHFTYITSFFSSSFYFQLCAVSVRSRLIRFESNRMIAYVVIVTTHLVKWPKKEKNTIMFFSHKRWI